MKVAVFDAKKYDIEFFNEQNKDKNYEIEFFEPKLNESTVIMAKGFDVVSVFVNDNVNDKVIDKLNEYGVKLITLRCAGYNNVDFEAAAGKIKVTRVPAYSPYAVAEFTIAMIMTLNRKLHKSYNRTREANFTLNGLLGFDMFGKTIGLIGTGKIAQILIRILKGFGMRVVAYSPFEEPEAAKILGFEYVSLDELYEVSDIISLHCPLNEHTKYIINENSISKMKDGVMIINTGRGGLIKTIDLIEGLKSTKVGYAGLDVYEEEADYFFDDYSNEIISDDMLARLLSFNNVLITSHQGFFTDEALSNIAETTFLNIHQLENGLELENEVVYSCDSNGCAIREK